MADRDPAVHTAAPAPIGLTPDGSHVCGGSLCTLNINWTKYVDKVTKPS